MQVKIAELPLDSYRMMQTLEWHDARLDGRAAQHLSAFDHSSVLSHSNDTTSLRSSLNGLAGVGACQPPSLLCVLRTLTVFSAFQLFSPHFNCFPALFPGLVFFRGPFACSSAVPLCISFLRVSCILSHSSRG